MLGDGSWTKLSHMSVCDVHKETIAVALAEAGVRGDVREYGKAPRTRRGLLKALATKLSRKSGTRFGSATRPDPCGYGIQRQLTLAGHDCVVVAPSLIPRKPGDRIKTGPAGCDQPRQACIAPENLDHRLGSGSSSRGDPRSLYAHVLRPSAV